MIKVLIVVLAIITLILAGIGASVVTIAIKNLLFTLAIFGVITLLIIGHFQMSKEQEEEDNSVN